MEGAIKNGWKINSFIYHQGHLSDWAKGIIRTIDTEVNYCLTLELMNELSNKTDSSELMAIVEMQQPSLENVELSSCPFIILFDRPSNKGNLGTIIRSCDSFGVDLLMVTGHSVDLYDPDVITATMGSFFNVKTIYVSNTYTLFRYIDTLRKRFSLFMTIGTTAHNETPIYDLDLTRPLLLMIGNETMGLNKAFKDSSDLLSTIPMCHTSYASSLNVGCAASVLMYEVTKQRGRPCRT